MISQRYDRQNFLGPNSGSILNRSRVAVVGLGGGGSHIVQQLAHIGVGNFVLIDSDIVEDSNLNRLVGATEQDVIAGTPKTDVATRMIMGVNSRAIVSCLQARWQDNPMLLRDCDLIFGCLDGYSERDQLDRLARRFLIPYIDIGMDVSTFDSQYLVTGQVALSVPDAPCMWCMGVLTEQLLTEEAQRYGKAGARPQVIWPNAVLASTAIGLFMHIVTPWCISGFSPVLFEYDGNNNTVSISNKEEILAGRICPHFSSTDRGDPFYTKTVKGTKTNGN